MPQKLAIPAFGVSFAAAASGGNNRIFAQPVNTASVYWQRFIAAVDQVVRLHQAPWGSYSALFPALAYRVTGDPTYATAAVATADAWVASENALVTSGSPPVAQGGTATAPGTFLYALDHIQPVACCYDWCTSFVSPAQATAWASYCNQCVFNIWNWTQAAWNGKPFPWSGWGTSNYGDNYYYRHTATTIYATLAFGGDLSLPDSKLQLAANYLATLPEGGSEEGTYYGQSHRFLFDAYPVWAAAGKTDYAKANTHCQNALLFWLHATVPTTDEFAPIGDQPRNSLPIEFDYNRHYIESAIVNSPQAPNNQGQGRWLLANVSNQTMHQQSELMYECQPWPGGTVLPAVNFYSALGCGQWFWRSGWTAADSWLCLVCAAIRQSHAHQEQGGFSLYKKGWQLVTSDIWSKSGIRQETDTNNVVRFADSTGKVVPQQQNKSPVVTVTNNASGLSATMDLSPMYAVPLTWRRSLSFDGKTLTVTDTVAPPAGGSAFLQLQLAQQPTIAGIVATTPALTAQLPGPPSEVLDWTKQALFGGDMFTAGWRISVPISGTVTTTVTLA